jgi:Flp pilus assembly pilin Flp
MAKGFNKGLLVEFIRDEGGQDIVEYSLLLVLIGAAALFVLTAMGTSIGDIFNKITTSPPAPNRSRPMR